MPLGEALPDARWVPLPLNYSRTRVCSCSEQPHINLSTLLLSTWLKPDYFNLIKTVFSAEHNFPLQDWAFRQFASNGLKEDLGGPELPGFRWWADKQPSVWTCVSRASCPDLLACLPSGHEGTEERRNGPVLGAVVTPPWDEGPWRAAGSWAGRRAEARV